MRGEEVIIVRVETPNCAPSDVQILYVAIALNYFLGRKPCTAVHCGCLGENIGHEIALPDRDRRCVEVIRRHLVTAVIVASRCTVRGRARLLALRRDIRVYHECWRSRFRASVLCGEIFKPERTMACAIEPDGEAFVVNLKNSAGRQLAHLGCGCFWCCKRRAEHYQQ